MTGLMAAAAIYWPACAISSLVALRTPLCKAELIDLCLAWQLTSADQRFDLTLDFNMGLSSSEIRSAS